MSKLKSKLLGNGTYIDVEGQGRMVNPKSERIIELTDKLKFNRSDISGLDFNVLLELITSYKKVTVNNIQHDRNLICTALRKPDEVTTDE